jgi:hypothetical protein
MSIKRNNNNSLYLCMLKITDFPDTSSGCDIRNMWSAEDVLIKNKSLLSI